MLLQYVFKGIASPYLSPLSSYQTNPIKGLRGGDSITLITYCFRGEGMEGNSVLRKFLLICET